MKFYNDRYLCMGASNRGYEGEVEHIDPNRLLSALNSSMMLVYPNPASDYVTIAAEAEQRGDVDIVVYDMTGLEVLRTHLPITQKQTTLSLQSLTKGIYHLQLFVEGQSRQVTKLIIK